jgi:hypothetical protein
MDIKAKKKIEKSKNINEQSESDLLKWANDVTKEGNLNAGLNPRLLAAHAIRSADWIKTNGEKFVEWSKAMVKEFGESIRRHLNTIWKAAKEALAEGSMKWLERTGGIKFMSDNTGRPPAPERPAARPAFSKWQELGVGSAKDQAEALDNAWKAFRGQSKAKGMSEEEIAAGWETEAANPDSPFITRAVKQIKAKEPVDTGAYHYGDGGTARDTVLNRMGGRSTGHFGTGVYFLGSKSEKARPGREMKMVDVSRLKMAKPSDPYDLHKGLKLFNNAIIRKEALDFSQPRFDASRALFHINLNLGLSKHKEAEVRAAMEKIESLFNEGKNDGILTPSTYLMRELGYDGIDVRGTAADNTDYGSVVFRKPTDKVDVVEPDPIPAGGGFNFAIPTLTKTAKGWALAGKPLEGEAGNIPVAGLAGISQLKDGELELYRKLVPEAFFDREAFDNKAAELRKEKFEGDPKDREAFIRKEAFQAAQSPTGEYVNIPTLMDGLAKAGPQVEVHTYGQGGKIIPEKDALDKMTHEWWDTLSGEKKYEYNSAPPPGTEMKHGEAVKMNEEQLSKFRSNLKQDGWTDEEIQKAVEYDNLQYEAVKAVNAAGPTGPRATSYYNSISPFDTKKHPVIRVDVVLPEPLPSKEKFDAASVEERRKMLDAPKPLWQQDDLHENLPNTLGWAMVQVVPDPKTGEDVLFVGELQSRWGQARQKDEKEARERVRQIPSGWENAGKYEISGELGGGVYDTKEEAIRAFTAPMRNAPFHPLLDVHQPLVLKAVIAEARKRGIKKVVISDGETAMMTEMHDQHAKPKYEKEFLGKWVVENENDRYPGVGGPHDTKEKAEAFRQTLVNGAKVDSPEYGSVIMSADVRDKYKVRQVTEEDTIPKPGQEGGMRLAYDTTLPSIMGKLTGEKGELVDMGVHKNAQTPIFPDRPFFVHNRGRFLGAMEGYYDSREKAERHIENVRFTEDSEIANDLEIIDRTEEIENSGSPVFQKDGKKKKNVTGRAYVLDGLDQRRATQLFADPFGFQLVKSSLVIAAREAGNLGRFTNRIVKQWGKWIADHAKALWQAASKGANAVGEYLKSLTPSSTAANTRMGMAQGTAPTKVSRVGAINFSASSPVTKAKTGSLLQGIADILKKPGERTPSGLLEDRSKMGKARKLFHDVVGNPVDEMKRIHPVLGAAMEHMDFRTAQEAKDYETRLDPAWNKVFRKLGDKDTPLRLAYLKGDVVKQHEIVRSVAGDEGVKLYEEAIRHFDHFYAKAVKAGIKLNKVNRYLPTRLKAGQYPELLDILARNGLTDDISRVLKKTNKEIAGMDEFEAGEVMQGAIASVFGPASSKHFKSRTGIALHEKVMEEIAPLYESFDHTIGHYGVQLTDAIVRAETLGPDSITSLKDFMEGRRTADNVISESSPLGLIVERLKRDGELNAHDLVRIKELVNARMGYLPDGFVEKWLKSGNMSLALANPFSAIRQPGTEIVKSLWKNGVLPTILGIKDTLKGRGINAQRDLFLSPDFEIGQGNDPIKRINQRLAKLSGFRAADLFPATVMANAALRRLQTLSPEARSKELDVLKDFFSGPDKTATLKEVSAKIAKGEFNDPDVWRVAWHEVTKLRPTGLGTRPVAVLRNRGLARVAANLKEWGLRNINFMKDATYDNLRSGDPAKVKEGLAALSLLTTAMVAAGAAADGLVDWLLGKDVQFSDKVKDNMLKMALGSRYQLNQIMGANGQKPSIKDALLNYMSTPTLSMIDSLGGAVAKSAQDDEKSFMDIVLKDKQLARAVPLGVGTAYFSWFGESGEKDRANQVEARLPEQALQLTEETGKLRALGEDGRKKRPGAQRRWEQLSDFSQVKSWRVKLAQEAAKARDFGEADAQLRELEAISRNPHRWSGEADRISRLKKARERLEKAA